MEFSKFLRNRDDVCTTQRAVYVRAASKSYPLECIRLVFTAYYYRFMHGLHLSDVTSHPLIILAMPPITVRDGRACTIHTRPCDRGMKWETMPCMM